MNLFGGVAEGPRFTLPLGSYGISAGKFASLSSGENPEWQAVNAPTSLKYLYTAYIFQTVRDHLGMWTLF
jgi:hypothetical protein